MTMHVVLGDGEMARKELTETLSDIWKADEKEKATFWFLVQGKPEPSDTDKALMDWLHKNEIYYEVITDDKDGYDKEVYTQPQVVHEAKRMAPKIVNLMNTKPEEGELAELLALYWDDTSTAPQDAWLNSVSQTVFEAGYQIRALNDGLVIIDLAPSAEEPEAEPAPAKAPAKAVAKKAAARVDTEVSEDEAVAAGAYTREGLEELELPQLKEIAASLGLELAPRTRITTYIDAILNKSAPEPPPVEVEVEPDVGSEAVVEPPTLGTPGLNGLDMNLFAKQVARAVVEELREMKFVVASS